MRQIVLLCRKQPIESPCTNLSLGFYTTTILVVNRFKTEVAFGVVKKGALQNFTKFTMKHRCQSIFLNKVVDLTSEWVLL